MPTWSVRQGRRWCDHERDEQHGDHPGDTCERALAVRHSAGPPLSLSRYGPRGMRYLVVCAVVLLAFLAGSTFCAF
jgi:hypothetical protein